MIRRRHAGFTLLEILIAVAIFVIVGTLAMGGYNELVRQSDILDSSAKRTRAVQATVNRMTQDFAMLEPRPVREPLGSTLQPSLQSDARTEAIADLTHSGWSNPAGVPRGTLQRVSYRLENNTLKREYWVVLDRPMTAEPTTTVMLDKVRAVSVRYMAGNGTWHDQWPPQGFSAPNISRTLPIAVEFTLELEDWGKIVRLVEVSG
jgi:general secretion pathway protein J